MTIFSILDKDECIILLKRFMEENDVQFDQFES